MQALGLLVDGVGRAGGDGIAGCFDGKQIAFLEFIHHVGVQVVLVPADQFIAAAAAYAQRQGKQHGKG